MFRGRAPFWKWILTISKKFNDIHGHMAGDVMLRNPGVILEENVRLDDIACRYVGGESVIVISMLVFEKAFHRLENIRKLFQKMPAIYQDGPIYATFSGRMGSFPQYTKSPQDIMMAAERVFYEAEAQDRNCIVDIHRSNK